MLNVRAVLGPGPDKETTVETEHAEKTHPIAGYISALVLAGAMTVDEHLFALNTNEKAIVGVTFLFGWAIISLVIFTRREAGEEH